LGIGVILVGCEGNHVVECSWYDKLDPG